MLRKRGTKSAGRGRNAVLVAVAVSAMAVFTFWPSAEATPTEVEQLTGVLVGSAGESRKAMAIERLRLIDTTAARTAISDLAGSSQDRVAVLALRTLGRCNWSGAKTRIEQIYGNTGRSVFVRGAALAAWCTYQHRNGASWSSCRTYANGTAGTNSQLLAEVTAIKAKYWPTAVDDE